MNSKTLNDIRNNVNTGVEYEIALFLRLLQDADDIREVQAAIRSRSDAVKIDRIARRTDLSSIDRELRRRGLRMIGVSLETQNDEVGPADVVMHTEDSSGATVRIGLSVKYSNTCTLNVTGRRFITAQQVTCLQRKLAEYTGLYVDEMRSSYGNATNWFRKRKPSKTTDAYIDLIRDEVVKAWGNKESAEKIDLLRALYQEDSPIEYWVYEYTASSCHLEPEPFKVNVSDVDLIEVRKYETSYVGFYLRGRMIGKMQVKFNNGFVEKCKKISADLTVDGIRMSYGQPFSSWNFSLV